MIKLNKVGSRLCSLEEIPEPLRSQILEFRDTQINQVLSVLNKLGGIASLSEIIVHLWYNYKICVERNYFLTKIIYKMIRKGLIRKFQNRKGIYCLSTFKG